MNMEINNEGQGLDPLYDQGLYLDKQAALHLDHNDGGQPHQVVGGGNNIDDQLGDVQDGLTLDSLSRCRFTEAEYEARVSSPNGSQRVPYEKIVEYTITVLEYRMGNRESMPNPLRIFITGGASTGKNHVISVVKEHLERAHIGDENACILMAPTGVAAFNIGGLTIH